MRIAFCTACHDRAPHVKLTLPDNLKSNADYANAVFVIIDYDSPDDLLDYLKTCHAAEIASGRVVVYSYRNGGEWHMARSKNISHRCALLEGADVLVNMDADNYTGHGFAHYIARQYAERGPDMFMWAKMVKGVLVRGINGRIIVTREQFMASGGYNEVYREWARDDRDFNERLCRLGYIPQEIDSRFLLAERHSDALRFKKYPHFRAKYDSGDLPPMSESEVTVANFGQFGCGTVMRNFDPAPIELNPVPTRVFGVGMHKTSTTSLHHAFKILGYDSWHWKSAREARAIYSEMMTFGKSSLLERYYALADLPITLLYEQLDRAYPGSRFILTTRDERSWLDSVERHWNHDSNPWRAQWDRDSFSHQVHQLLYGQKNFNAEVFLTRFRRHNGELREYFKHRAQDLLVMETPGWTELCAFLGKSIPDTDYPYQNLTRK